MAFVTGRLTANVCKSVLHGALWRSSQLSTCRTNSSRQLRLPPKSAPFSTDAIANAPSTANSTPTGSTSESTALKLSDACVRKLQEICKDDATYLRVLVDGGGCSGFQYKFELDAIVNDDDVRFGPDGRVLIDAISLDYCAGATLDYSVELIKSGFRMVGNPKAEQGCSCGASFALKL